jgi:hypothetical protein
MLSYFRRGFSRFDVEISPIQPAGGIHQPTVVVAMIPLSESRRPANRVFA